MRPVAFVLLLSGAAWGGSQKEEADVAVYVMDHVQVPMPVLTDARYEAARLLAGAGVRVQWKVGKPKRTESCGIVIPLLIRESSDHHIAHALAFTTLADGSVTVLYDRIAPAGQPLAQAAIVLAHVFAHEIGHSLEGVSFHSETGLMKAHWTQADYAIMLLHPLKFTDDDVLLIHAGVDRPCPSPATRAMPH